jgi:hypothetical protein
MVTGTTASERTQIPKSSTASLSRNGVIEIGLIVGASVSFSLILPERPEPVAFG